MFVCCGIKKANYNIAIQTVQTICMTMHNMLEFAQNLGMCIHKQEKSFFCVFFVVAIFACFTLLCVIFLYFFSKNF